MRNLIIISMVVACLSVLKLGHDLKAQEFDIELANSGQKFLNSYCKKCHGDGEKYPGLDVTDLPTLFRPIDESEDPFVVPGKPDESRLWDALESEYMPPEKQKQPTAEEKEQFKKWIEAGAHFPPEPRPKRTFLGEETVLKMIADDLDQLPPQQIPYTRYFSLAHLWNDTEGTDPTTPEDLRFVRAALSKLVNSLSNRSRIVVPRMVDKENEVLLAIDMRDYGWDEWSWNEIIKLYPYGLKVGGRVATRVYRDTGTRIPYLRADWFITNASRPPLYHTLLRIPQNAKTLEADLGVDIYRNFMDGKLVRAAFEESGISDQNRMVERHDTTKGGRYYWKSYDIKPDSEELGDFSRRPLGPKFDQYEGRQPAAFVHDGGEIIWGLPNGLQAYMLVTGADERIDVGPDEVVADPNQHSGTFRIVTGISCIGCHKHGMVKWKKDEIREIFEKLEGQSVADKVLELFPANESIQKLVDGDQAVFLRALDEAIGRFVRDGADDQRTMKDFPDPISRVAKRYRRNLNLSDIARELGLPLTDEEAERLEMKSGRDLKVLVETPVFKGLGLANLSLKSGSISRETWERAYGRAARNLRLGVPIVPFGN